MNDRQLMQQAFDALELLAKWENPSTKWQIRKPKDGGPIVTIYPHKVAADAASLLRERLAREEQEPLTEIRIEELYSFWIVDCQDIVGFARALERSKPQMQPCAGRNCGSTNPNVHSAECFEDYEMARGMAQQEPVAWFDKELNTVKWKDGLLNCDLADQQPLYTAPQPAQQPAQEPEQEQITHAIVAGVLFDFMGWLTSRKKRIVLSSADDASPAVVAIHDFAEMRGLILHDPKVQDWQDVLAKESTMPEQYVMVGRFMLQPHPENGYWLTNTGTCEAMQIFQPEMERVIKDLWKQF